jgi:uncharacterized protein (DUF1778 family)
MRVTEAERMLFLMTPADFNAFIKRLNEPAQVKPRLAEFMRENRTAE